MRVYKTRQNGLAVEVHLLCIPRSEREDLLIRPDRQKAAVVNGDCLRPGLARVHRPKIAVVEDKLGLRALHGKQHRPAHCAQTVEKLSTRSRHQNSFCEGKLY